MIAYHVISKSGAMFCLIVVALKNALSFNIRFVSLYYNLIHEKYVLIDSPFMNV